MTPLSLESVLAGTGAVVRGQLADETTFTRIERDARQAKPGDLYLAVRGERFDGHDFVADAAANGALPPWSAVPGPMPTPIPRFLS